MLDDLSASGTERIPGLPLVEIDLVSDAASATVAALLRKERIDAVMHFAARKSVDESVRRPAWYYEQNLTSLAHLLMAMEESGVDRLVFSSSAAVYGSATGEAIGEDTPLAPISPYGETKRAGEQLISAASIAFGLRATSLRYFNVGGAGSVTLANHGGGNLIPLVFERLDRGLPPLIHGDDYPTRDGTCVRDYIHVVDLAEAHVAALDYLAEAPAGNTPLNVGTGRGTTVHEMVDAILRASGSPLAAEVGPRRDGDPASSVASAARIHSLLGWTAKRGIDEIVQSDWAAHQAARAAGRPA
ncbi:UDP-glucose 4-epimerase GalE [Gryllotalpicola daejeonensis]|uniref:UDP-glucose 4-epimerase n=1 Tax=Gryllotalpicola daejeonensis TaxID=993087 RepID=A0ABP7ZNQ7_9MICO